MDITKVKQHIKKAISGLKIPAALREDAEQEGFVAYLEDKDIRKTVRAWLKSQLDFRDKLGVTTERDNAIQCGEALDDPDNTKRRIDSGTPKYNYEIVDDEIFVYEEI